MTDDEGGIQIMVDEVGEAPYQAAENTGVDDEALPPPEEGEIVEEEGRGEAEGFSAVDATDSDPYHAPPPRDEDYSAAGADEEVDGFAAANADEGDENQPPPIVADPDGDEEPALRGHQQQPRKQHAPIVRPKKPAAKAQDPALPILNGGWTAQALSHAQKAQCQTRNGVDRAVASGHLGQQGADVHITPMTQDTHGMQKLYTRMLTTKMWW